MYLFRDRQLNPRREIRSALLTIYGVNWCKSVNVVSRAGLSYPYFMKNIKPYQFSIVFFLLKSFVISSVRIKRRIESNINNMINNTSYQGVRHKLGLPVRGQRTRTNAGTQRAKRVRYVNKIIKNK